jgi:hypothetical protein
VPEVTRTPDPELKLLGIQFGFRAEIQSKATYTISILQYVQSDNLVLDFAHKNRKVHCRPPSLAAGILLFLSTVDLNEFQPDAAAADACAEILYLESRAAVELAADAAAADTAVVAEAVRSFSLWSSENFDAAAALCLAASVMVSVILYFWSAPATAFTPLFAPSYIRSVTWCSLLYAEAALTAFVVLLPTALAAFPAEPLSAAAA